MKAFGTLPIGTAFWYRAARWRKATETAAIKINTLPSALAVFLAMSHETPVMPV